MHFLVARSWRRTPWLLWDRGMRSCWQIMGRSTVGRNLREAFNNCELLEKTARVYVLAMGLGALTPVPADMAEVEKAFFAGMFGEA